VSEDRGLIPKEVAYRLNVNVHTVYKMLQSGRLKGFKLGAGEKAQWRILESVLNEYMGKE
jgi:excisionase family DNA binding protein